MENVEIDTILDILLNSNREYRLFYPAKRGIIKIRFVKKENESFIISIARQIRENHLRWTCETNEPCSLANLDDEKRRRPRRRRYFVRSLPRAVCKFAARTCSCVAGTHTRAPPRVRTCPRRDKGAYGRLTVPARHTYLMDFRRYAVGRAYTHANPAVQISPRKRDFYRDAPS